MALAIFVKNPIITLRLGSKCASVIINLILASATQLYSKINKIKEIFIVNAHFYLKLVQKFRKKKSPPFGGPLWLHTKTNSCQLSHLNRLSGLHLMSLMYRKEFRGILSPETSSQEQFFLIKKKPNFFHLCRWRFLSFFGTAHVTQKL